MKILAGILISLYLGLTLFGLYQYKAHDRNWGVKLVVWMSAVLLVGMGVQGWALLMVHFGICFCLAYIVGWRFIGSRFKGWRQHLIRGVAFALCLGPLAAMRHSSLYRFDAQLAAISRTTLKVLLGTITPMARSDILRFILYGLPGFFLIGAISFLVSAGRELWYRADGKFAAVVLSRREKLGYSLLLLALLLSVNWYVAGAFLNFSSALGQTRVLQWVLWSRPGSVNAKLRDDTTPLHRAASWGQTGAVKLLVNYGARVNAEDNDGETPLHGAAWNDQTETAKILLKAGAKVNAKDKDGDTPLHVAALNGHTEEVKILLEAKAEVNAKDYMLGWTPLHYVAREGHTETAETLLKAGAKVNAKDKWGNTPLHSAAEKGHTDTAETLLKAGAKVNAKDKDGDTPLDKAKDRRTWLDPKKQDECAKLLRKHGARTGAELDAETKQGKTE